MRYKYLIKISSIFTFLQLVFCHFAAGTQNCTETFVKINDVTTCSYNDYKIIVSSPNLGKVPKEMEAEGPDEIIGEIKIFKGGKLMFTRKDQYTFGIGRINEKNDTDLLTIGKDITGDGNPDLVIFEWTLGAHCCFGYHIFSIGEEFKYIDFIDLQHSDNAEFKDLDSDGNLEIIANDWTFAYWKTSFVQSPAPQIILKFQNGRYEPSKKLMSRKKRDLSELAEHAKEVKNSKEWFLDGEHTPPSSLWAYMLDLIYEGNKDQAFEFFNLAWPEGIKGKNDFQNEFNSKLKTSVYWPFIEKINN